MSTVASNPEAVAPNDQDGKLITGYRQSELGVIPKSWSIADIGSLNPFVTSGSRGWADFYSDIGAPFIRITNLSRESIDLDLSDLKLVDLPPHAAAEASRTQLHDCDLLISITADIGIIGYVDARTPKPAYMNQHIALIRFNQSAVCSRFAAYSLASERPQRLFVASIDVGAKAGMSLLTVRKIRLALPPFPEQREIAAALSDVDGLIGALDKLITKKRAIKQASMQQLLTGKTRLPGFEGEWEIKTLGQVCKIVSGGTPSTAVKAFWDGTIPWCTPTDITGCDGKYLHATARNITQEGLQSSAATLLPAGSILLCTRATIGEMKIATQPVSTNQGFKSLVCNTESCNEFVYYKLLMMKRELVEKGVGSTFLEVSKADVASLEIRSPELDEQRAIAAVLSDMDAEIAALERRRDKIKVIKQGMMQVLLTGRVRLIRQGATA